MTLRPIAQLSLCLLLTGTLWAAADPFAGTWKLNPAKSKLTDEMKVEAAGPNKYTLNFSGDNTETIVADGTDQPGVFGTTFSIAVVSDHEWKVVRKNGGKITIVGIWNLSDDGNTLTDHFTGYRADGSSSTVLYKYARTGGGSGFAGTWDSTVEQVNAFEMQIRPFQEDGLSLIIPQRMTRNVKFDGKDYAAEGANLLAGYALSGRRASDKNIELTDKVSGKVMDTQELVVSPDGGTLTITTHQPGRAVTNVQVFDREDSEEGKR